MQILRNLVMINGLIFAHAFFLVESWDEKGK